MKNVTPILLALSPVLASAFVPPLPKATTVGARVPLYKPSPIQPSQATPMGRRGAKDLVTRPAALLSANVLAMGQLGQVVQTGYASVGHAGLVVVDILALLFMRRVARQGGNKYPILPLVMVMMVAELFTSGLLLSGSALKEIAPNLLLKLWYIPQLGHSIGLPLLIPTLTLFTRALDSSYPRERLRNFKFKFTGKKAVVFSWLAGGVLAAIALYVVAVTPPQFRTALGLTAGTFKPTSQLLKLDLAAILIPSFVLLGSGLLSGFVWGRIPYCLATLVCFARNIPSNDLFRFFLSTCAEVYVFIALAVEVQALLRQAPVEQK